MACFLVPAGEAVATTIITKLVKSKEEKERSASDSINVAIDTQIKIPFSHKLKWLNNMLWGGSALLAFEHIWHGEVVPWFPFLTAAENPIARSEMLQEMSTVGVAMALLVSAVWVGITTASNVIEKRPQQAVKVKAHRGRNQ
ncbi:MAG: hypothetical protein HFI71_07515 [Lachnospiraceae bacterium]|nr:hypothetical protein [Lachnospiraceae bacterium]